MVKSIQTSILANSTNTNVFSGSGIENVPVGGRAYRVQYYSTGSAAGLQEEIFVGPENPVELSDVSTQNRKPIVPDDGVAEFLVAPGSKVRVRVSNTTGGALTHFATLAVTQAA